MKPFRQGVIAFGCGQCLPCRLNRRRLWTARLLLEQRLHKQSLFVTLTFDGDSAFDGNLSIECYKLFLKRLRYYMGGIDLRYFIVGEYGEKNGRPHYHALLFASHFSVYADNRGHVRCVEVEKAWRFGYVYIGNTSSDSIGYVVSYLLKGGRKVQRSDGRVPEFARMSLNPAIGAGAMLSVEEVMTTKAGCEFIYNTGDVVKDIRIEGKVYPLGRYLRGKLRERLGMEKGQPVKAAEIMGLSKQIALSVPGAFDKERQARIVAGQRAEWFRRNRMKGKL